jgi:DNA modification methylase
MTNISDIKPYPKNAKKHSQKQVKQVADSIKRFGFVQPLVIDKNNEIVIGHCRYEAAKLLNLTEVPTVSVENLTDEEVKALRLADNKLNESGWDMDLALEDLKGLNTELFNLTGFENDILIDVKEDDFDAQAEYDKILEPTAKLGDLYQLGSHRLLCGDSTQPEAYSRLLEGSLADMVFTDPPYNVGYDYKVSYQGSKKSKKRGVFDDSKTDENFELFINSVFTNLFNNSKEGSCFYCWHASRTSRLFWDGIVKAGWHISQTLFWLKNQPTLSWLDYLWIIEPCYFGWKGKNHFVNKQLKLDRIGLINLDHDSFEELLDVVYSKRDSIATYIHPTQKPIRLAERALKKHCMGEGIVLEPFNGSGSTMMACEQLKRRCYAIELDPKFVDVAIKRWEQSTNQKAIKL